MTTGLVYVSGTLRVDGIGDGVTAGRIAVDGTFAGTHVNGTTTTPGYEETVTTECHGMVFGSTEVATTTGLENEVGMTDECPENGLVGTVEMETMSWSGTLVGTSLYGTTTLVVDGKMKTQCETGASDPGITTADDGRTLDGGNDHPDVGVNVWYLVT